jgi:hypothetical protein
MQTIDEGDVTHPHPADGAGRRQSPALLPNEGEGSEHLSLLGRGWVRVRLTNDTQNNADDNVQQADDDQHEFERRADLRDERPWIDWRTEE